MCTSETVAQAAVTAWQLDFKNNLTLANLPEGTPLEAAQDALALFDRMHVQLQKIRDIRINRIGAMRLAQKDFDAQAKALALELAPDLEQMTAAQIALDLSQRLKSELAVADELQRLRLALEQTQTQLDAARQRLREANATLAPLLNQCGTQDKDSLRVAIASSDRWRVLNLQLTDALRQVLALGDGLGRDALAAEFAATDVNTLGQRLTEFKLEMDDSVAQQNRLSAELNAATPRWKKSPDRPMRPGLKPKDRKHWRG